MTFLPPIDISKYPEHARFSKRVQDAGGQVDAQICWVCGRTCKSKNPKWLQLANGGFIVTDPRIPTDDRWVQPIGPECLKNHPELKPYLTGI